MQYSEEHGRLVSYIQDWIDRHETTWSSLYKEAGLAPSSATGLRRGAKPGLSTLYALAKVMGIPAQTLFQLCGYAHQAEEEKRKVISGLSPDQIALLQEYEGLSVDDRSVALRLIRALRG